MESRSCARSSTGTANLRDAARSENSRSSVLSSSCGSNSLARIAASTADCAASSEIRPPSTALMISSSRPGTSAALRCRRRSRLASCGTGEAGPDSTSCASAMSVAIFSARIIAGARLRKLGLLARLRVELRQFGRRCAQIFRLARRRLDLGAVARQLLVGAAPALPASRRRCRPAPTCPPNASSRSRCAAGSTSARSSCWPWISTSARPMSRISDTLAGWSLTKTRVRPSAACTRFRMMSPSSSMALSARMARAGWLTRHVEGRGDLALRGAVAHQRRVAARAERQRQGIEQDRFAGAGLAGQHRKPGGKVDVQPFDQDDIADRQMRQHARS